MQSRPRSFFKKRNVQTGSERVDNSAFFQTVLPTGVWMLSSSAGHLRLADLGVCKDVQADLHCHLCQCSSLVGTPEYVGVHFHSMRGCFNDPHDLGM